MSLKRVLVTGANGQLGSCLQKLVKERPLDGFEFSFESSAQFDITDTNLVSKAFEEGNFTHCINCAAYTHVDKAETEANQARRINVDGVRNLGLACKAYNVILIHISTDFVFDGEAKNPYKEDDKTNPLGVYGSTKRLGEQYIEQDLERYFIVRTSWLYSEFGNNFMKTMLRLAKEKESLSVVNDQIGVPTYAIDLALFILIILKSRSKLFGTYHYSNQGETTWYGFAKAIFEISNSSIQLNAIPSNEYPTPAKRPKYSVLNTSKTTETFGIEIPAWQEALQRALNALNTIQY